jgi:acyl transferase domain-containing protein
MSRRVLVIAPGRGSYGPRELGSLGKIAKRSPRAEAAFGRVAAAVDAARADEKGSSVGALDGRASFTPDLLEAESASALIFAGSMLDFALLPEGTTIAGAIGNSLGFYTALALSGALDLEQGARLVVTMSRLQARNGKGGQLLYPVVDEEWNEVAERKAAIVRLLESGAVYRSIDLGGFAVLAALDPRKVDLPTVRQGGRDYPLVLEGHHGYHSPLVAAVAEGASRELGDLAWRRPRLHLVDGRGAIFTPWSADPAELAAYALGHQVREPFDFTTSLVTATRELAPDALVLLGPGESIGGAIGQTIVRERFFGIASKAAFLDRQRSEEPVLYALGRPEQRQRLLGEA